MAWQLAQRALCASPRDLRGRLAAIRVPTLVISGEHDRLFRLDQSREISGHIAGSRCSMIPGAGHLSNLDSPDQFNRVLLDFLSGPVSELSKPERNA